MNRQLNLVDLMSLVMILTSTAVGIGGVHKEKAGIFACFLFGLCGLLIGYFGAFASNLLAYKVLDSKRYNSFAGCLLYTAIPVCFLLGVNCITFYLTFWLAR